MNHNKTKPLDQGGCNYCGSVAHRPDCPSRKYNDIQGKSEAEKCATCGHEKRSHSRHGCIAILLVAKTPVQAKESWEHWVFRLDEYLAMRLKHLRAERRANSLEAERQRIQQNPALKGEK